MAQKTTWLLLCVLSLSAYAGETKTIRGQVLDKDSKFPLEGARVVVVDTGAVNGTATDAKGYFSLQVPLGRLALRISYMGYKDEVVSNLLVIAGKEINLTIELQERVSEIEEVVVSGKDEKGQVHNEFAVISARSFDVELTSRFSGNRNDPARMASNFAGVSGANDARNDIIIRGNSPMGMLWRLEGIDIPSPNHFAGFGSTGGPVSMLNNNTLARGDFMTSAFPSEYGNALSGVFDLALRQGNKDRYEFMAQLGFNGVEAGAEGPFSKKKMPGASFLFNYRYSTLALFKLLKANFGTGTAVPRYQDMNFKVDLPTEKAGTFRIWGLGGLSGIELLGSAVDLEKPKRNLYGNENIDLYNTVRTGMAGFSHTYFFNSKSYYKLMLGASHQAQLVDIDSINPINRDEIIRHQKIKLRQNKYSAHIMYNNKINARNTVTTGFITHVFDILFQDSVLAEGRFRPIKFGDGYSALSQLYAMWKHKFSEQLSLNAGGHMQFFTLSRSFAAEPRVSLKYQFAETQSVSIGYGLHHQTQPLPTYYNYDLSLPDSRPTNLDMGFTRSQHVVAGYDLFFLKDFHIKAEAYFQYIDRAPVERFQSSFSMLNAGADFGTPDNTNLVNKGKGRNYGVELTAEKFFSKGYYFLLTTSLFQSHYKASDDIWRNTAFNGKYVLNALGGYQILFGGKKNKTKRHTFAVDGKLTAAGGRYYTPIDLEASAAAHAEVRIEERAFSLKYKDYFRMDMKLSYRISYKKITQEISTDFQNIFNIQNIFRKVYNPRTNTLNNEYQQGLFILPQYRILF